MIKDRIIFIGRNTNYEITQRCFKFLAEYLSNSPHKIVAVVASAEEGTPSLIDIASSYNIPVLTPPHNDINHTNIVKALKKLNPTILLTVQFPAIYRSYLIRVPSRACLNVHRGWPLRGGSIDLRAITYGRKTYNGVLHHIDEGIDTGPILGKVSFRINIDKEDGYSLDKKVSTAGVKLIEKEFVPLLGKEIPWGTMQSISKTIYENKWNTEMKTLKPSMTLQEADALVRALNHPRERGAILKVDSKRYYVSKILKSVEDVCLNSLFIRVKFKNSTGFCLIKHF